MPNRQKESATGGAWRFRAYQEQQGFGGNHISAGAENCSINPKNAAELDEFRGHALVPVSTKAALFGGRPMHFLSGVDTYRQDQLASRCLMASADRSVALSGVKWPMPFNLFEV
jgi:hypothetical protein